MSRAAPIPTPGRSSSSAARLVGLVEPARDDDRVGRRLERLGQAPRRPERRSSAGRAAREPPGTRAARSSAGPRVVAQRARGGPGDRRMTGQAEPPRQLGPGSPGARRSRSAAWPGSPARRHPPAPPPGGAATPGRTGRRRSSRCRARTRRRPARAAGEPVGGQPRDPGGLGGRSLGGQRPAARRRPGRSGRRRIASIPSSGSTARMSRAAGEPSGSVTTLRQSYIP